MQKIVRLTFVAAVLLSAAAPVAAQTTAPGEPPGRSTIVGKVLDSDGKSAVPGVRILAYHLSSEQLFTSEPTSKKGAFSIEKLPYGYFDIAVERADGAYVGSTVLNVAPSSKAAIILTLQPFDQFAAERAQTREFPGSTLATTGTMSIKEKPKGREYWRSPKGIAILAGSGGALLLLLATTTDPEEPASPTSP